MINISSSSHNYEIIEKNIKSCVSKGWIGIGDHTKDFEEKFSKRIGRKFITVNNGTNALHLGLHLLDLKEGSKVLLPSFTFFGCIQAIFAAKLTPVICDVEQDANLSCDKIDAIFKKDIKGIMAVHYGGKCTQEIESFKDYNVKILEDAAQAVDTKKNNFYCGTIGNVGTFSFDSIKNIATPDLGGVCFDDDKIERALAFRNYGIVRNSKDSNEMWWDFSHVNDNVKYLPNDISCIFALEQLKNLKENQLKRKEIWERYQKEFESLQNINICQKYDKKESHSYFSYLVTIKKRNDFAKYMLKNNVYTVLRFPPLHINKKFKKYCCGSFENSQNLYENGINLPIHNNLNDNDLDKVINLVKKWCKN